MKKVSTKEVPVTVDIKDKDIVQADEEEGEEIDIGLESYETKSIKQVPLTKMKINTSVLGRGIQVQKEYSQTQCERCTDKCCDIHDRIAFICCCLIKNDDLKKGMCCACEVLLMIIIFLFSLIAIARILLVEQLTDYFYSATTTEYYPYMHFINSATLQEQIQVCSLHPQVLLYPSPGSVALIGLSGSTWLRYVLQEGTRVLTTSGNQICDVTLQLKGFRGECLSERNFYSSLVVSFTKQNDIQNYFLGLYYPSAYLFLIRNPFEGAIEEYGRQKAIEGYKNFEFVLPDDKLATRDVYESENSDWNKWLNDYIDNWIIERETAEKEYKFTDGSQVPKLVVFYEDLYDPSTFKKEINNILNFIHTHRGNRLGVQDVSGGTYQDLASNDLFHSCINGNTRISPRSLPISINDIKQETLTALCAKIGKYWIDEKWNGPCGNKI